MGEGFLRVEIFVGEHVSPVRNVEIIIRNANKAPIYEVLTDENGLTDTMPLPAPDKDGFNNGHSGPYFSVYDVEARAEGFEKVIVHGVQIFDEIVSILPIQFHPDTGGDTENIYIPREHGVDIERAMPYEPSTNNEPRRNLLDVQELIPFDQQPIKANELSIPSYITVHLGSPNAVAENVRVSFPDYIKNVASSEIFPFWEEAALYANIYAQISFALNRFYTVWYPSQGKDFDITNNTAFDQFFVKGRNIFENISKIVDEIFNIFIRRQGRREPFMASYCSGTTVTCPGMSQHGSQELALRGYSSTQILKYYYPDDIQLSQSTNFVSANVGAFPGYSLKEGSSGEAVRTMQAYLNRISGNWYIPPPGVPDGVFGGSTRASVMEFQKIFNLTPDGVIGSSTWYLITRVYVAAKELAELTSEGERIGIGASPPAVTISQGSRGQYVVELQFLLNFISEFYPSIPFVIQNAVFKDETKRSVVEFQKEFGLTPDGVVGPGTWNKLYEIYKAIQGAVVTPPLEPDPPAPNVPQFPGTALRLGSSGSNVTLMQNFLIGISKVYPSIPTITADGIFGSGTHTAVIEFQRLFGLTADGVIGPVTWYNIIDVYNNLVLNQSPQFPGTALRVGSRGNDVKLMQGLLRDIATVFPTIPTLTADGIFGSGTQSTVIAFQSLFGLAADGIIGKNTWDKIVYVYNSLPEGYTPQYPGTSLSIGSRGNNVLIMQKYLNLIADSYTSIPRLTADGIFGPGTQASVIAFQNKFALTPDGIIGRNTWNKIVSIYNLIIMNTPRISLAINSLNVSSTNRPRTNSNPTAMLLALKLSGMI